MPAQWYIEPNPDFKPETADQKNAYAEIVAFHKKSGALKVDAINATEAVQNSKGMYRIKPEAEAQEVSLKLPELKDMTNDQLKAMGLQMGLSSIKPGITRTQLIGLIERKMAAIEIVDDTEPVE